MNCVLMLRPGPHPVRPSDEGNGMRAMRAIRQRVRVKVRDEER